MEDAKKEVGEGFNCLVVKESSPKLSPFYESKSVRCKVDAEPSSKEHHKQKHGGLIKDGGE